MARQDLKELCRRVKSASERLALVPTQDKNRALVAMAGALVRHAGDVVRANQKDLKTARANGLPQGLMARLTLDKAKVKKMADSLVLISKLPDPVGRVISTVKRPNGLVIKKVRVPLGVILIIYESRPNVTADCIALCLKSGNSVILKGGSEALHSNLAIFRILSEAAAKGGVPRDAFGFITARDRAEVRKLLGFSEWINLVIPRGGEGLIREVEKISKIPVIKHTKGVCHVFVDKKADFKKSENIVINAKVQNPAVCNAMETLLVHEDAAPKFIPRICRALEERGVEIRGDEKTRRFFPKARKAAERDWFAEYLDLILAVRVVKDLKEAIAHIQKYGSHHSDAIVTEDKRAASLFTDSIDSACVFVNCSTRFNDGGEFGMGAEMGISTDKLHARGPMGLEELTSYKYVVLGHGQVRA